MLRRPLTAIRLTTEDVLEYDDSKSKENEQAGSAQGANGRQPQHQQQGLNGKPKTREQRIGLSQ